MNQGMTQSEISSFFVKYESRLPGLYPLDSNKMQQAVLNIYSLALLSDL